MVSTTSLIQVQIKKDCQDLICPLKLGLFFGAKRFGDKIQNNKKALVFERKKYQYQKYISDINGIDTKAHNNEETTVIRETRDWLKTAKDVPR